MGAPLVAALLLLVPAVSTAGVLDGAAGGLPVCYMSFGDIQPCASFHVGTAFPDAVAWLAPGLCVSFDPATLAYSVVKDACGILP